MTAALLSNNIVFSCPSCGRHLSAGGQMVGQNAECPFCQHQFTVTSTPEEDSLSGEADADSLQNLEVEITGLEGQLSENRTQSRELKGNMSRLNMELHRHQLRLNKLLSREEELTSALRLAQSRLPLD